MYVAKQKKSKTTQQCKYQQHNIPLNIRKDSINCLLIIKRTQTNHDNDEYNHRIHMDT